MKWIDRQKLRCYLVFSNLKACVDMVKRPEWYAERLPKIVNHPDFQRMYEE